MKKFILLLLSLFLLTSSVLSQSSFPTIMSDEWKKLPLKDKIASCQIDPNELKLLSTEKLIEKSLNYPLILSIFYFDDFQEGFENAKEDFNGLSELFTRDDVFQELYKKYIGIEADKIYQMSKSIRPGRISLNIAILEIFLTQPEILNKLNNTGKKILIRAFLEKYNQMLKYNHKQGLGNGLYSNFTIAVLLSSMTRIIDRTEFSTNLRNNFEVKKYDKFSNKLCVDFLDKKKFPTIKKIADGEVE